MFLKGSSRELNGDNRKPEGRTDRRVSSSVGQIPAPKIHIKIPHARVSSDAQNYWRRETVLTLRHLARLHPLVFEALLLVVQACATPIVPLVPTSACVLFFSGSERFIGKALDDRFTPDDFKTEVFLGTGSFGRVTLVTFKDK